MQGTGEMILVMYSNFLPSERHLAALSILSGNGSIHIALDEADAVAHAPESEIILGHRYLRQVLPHANRLRWVQSTAGGIDILQAPELLQQQILVSRNPVHSKIIAHHAMASAWALLRRIPEAALYQAQGKWVAPSLLMPLPLPRTALVMGLGEIGKEICRLLRALGIKVRGTARTGSSAQRAACDAFVPFEKWQSVLGGSDLCFLALPLTPTTRGLLGAAEMAQLPPHAVIVNIARGPIIDMAALATALEAGKLGGAAVDVIDPIPAPDSSLWHTPHLLITPKLASYHPGMQEQTERFVEKQVARYLQGDPIGHVVDKDTLRESMSGRHSA